MFLPSQFEAIGGFQAPLWNKKRDLQHTPQSITRRRYSLEKYRQKGHVTNGGWRVGAGLVIFPPEV